MPHNAATDAQSACCECVQICNASAGQRSAEGCIVAVHLPPLTMRVDIFGEAPGGGGGNGYGHRSEIVLKKRAKVKGHDITAAHGRPPGATMDAADTCKEGIVLRRPLFR